MSDDDEQKPVVIFNRDISSIPCFRSSFLYGIGSGFVGGLGYFLFTSNTRMATHVGFSSFIVITLSYWCHCRWQWTKTKFSHGQLQTIMKKHTMSEGTEYNLTDKGEVHEVSNEA